MAPMSSQSIIKQLRTDRGISQSDLCAGICSQEQLSRIERGNHKPNWYTFKALMERLGEKPEQYFHSIISGDEKRVLDIQNEIAGMMADRRSDEVAARLAELDNDDAFSVPVHKAWLLTCKAAVSIPSDPEKALELIMAALKTTRPDFEIDKIATYLLSVAEVSRLNTLAIIKHYTDGHEEGLRISLMLKKNMDNGHYDEKTYAEWYLLVFSNVLKPLEDLGRFEESLDCAEKGIVLSLRYEQYRYYVKFNIAKTIGLFFLKRREEAISSLRQTIHLLRGHGRHQDCDKLLASLEKHFGVRVREEIIIEAPEILTNLA